MAEDYTAYYHWLSLFNFIEFLQAENYIEKETADKMFHHVEMLKQYIEDGEEE